MLSQQVTPMTLRSMSEKNGVGDESVAGVAAILRYPLPDLDELEFEYEAAMMEGNDDESDSDSDDKQPAKAAPAKSQAMKIPDTESDSDGDDGDSDSSDGGIHDVMHDDSDEDDNLLKPSLLSS